MELIQLSLDQAQYIKDAVSLLIEAFPHAYSDCAEEEIKHCLDVDRIAIAAIENDRLIGFVGAIPQYGVTAWELHPLVGQAEYRNKGIGTKLCSALEHILREKGCFTIYLGSDDEDGSTTLSNTDLFENTYQKIEAIKNLNQHPYEFYQKIGYKIVGVIPDANGIGKPDIWLAKSIRKSIG